MSITWERRYEALKAIWEKLDALTKALESIGTDILRMSAVESGAIQFFSLSATGDVITPSSGKAVKINGFFLYTDADIEARLNFKNSDDTIGGLKGQGVCAMNLLGMKKPQGDVDEVVELTITGTGNAEGWISYEEV